MRHWWGAKSLHCGTTIGLGDCSSRGGALFGERMRMQDLCLHMRLLRVSACSSGRAHAEEEKSRLELQCGVMSVQ